MTLDTQDAPAAQRHDVIDALRGFALFGVLLVNLGSLSLYEFLPQAERDLLPTAGFDRVALLAMQWFVDVKAITVFSLLFGVGFALQLQSAAARGGEGLTRFVRRMAGLFAIGLVHMYFVWWGDILATYAVVGCVLVLFRRASTPVLLVAAVLFALVLPPLIGPTMREVLVLPRQDAVYAQALLAFSQGTLAEAWQANALVANWARVANWALVGFVLGRFLLGYWAGATGLLQQPDAHRGLLLRLFLVSLLTGVVLSLLQFNLAALRVSQPGLFEGAVGVGLRIVLRAAPLALGIANATGFVLFYLRPAGARRLGWLAPVGRMALTNYLMQSVLGVAVFYGVGLGIGPRFGVAGWWLAAGVIFSFQVVASRVWLRRFRFGPMEWLWRCATYGAWQPMRRARLL